MTTAPQTSYDEVPYESFPFPQTHPDRLAALATLFGIEPPDPARCRVLELGCAAGGNLLPMAVAMPQASFTGVDLSPVQVAQGRALIDALRLPNVQLHAMSIADIGAGFGEFDYIVAHGVYSWVPNEVQEKILDICSRRLAARGVAYVSYNTLPGWRMRGMIRDLMRLHAMQFGEPAARVAQARAILDFLAKSVPTADSAYGILLKTELETLRRQPDYYILHEHLEDINEPLYFEQFIERAGRHGLQYLAEADFTTMLASNFADEVTQTLHSIAPDVIRQEQFMDFLRNRTFRQTLLVHAGVGINRALKPERVTSLWASAAMRAASAKPDIGSASAEEFQGPGGARLRTEHPITKAAAVVLADRWPRALGFAELLREAAALARRAGAAAAGAEDDESILSSDLLQCYAAGLLQLHAMPSRFVTRITERPRASALARRQAQHGRHVTNLRHEVVELDANLRRLLGLLDGSRRRQEIESTLAGWAAEQPSNHGRSRKEIAALVRDPLTDALRKLAKAALLAE